MAKNVTATLVIRALRGDTDSFTELVQAHLGAAYSVVLAILGRPADAEDMAQGSFLIAFERLDTCREPERFAGWSLQIVRNQARNALASRWLRDVPAQEELSSTLPVPDSSAFRSQLLPALDALSPVRREVISLHDLEVWTHPEIAALVFGTHALLSHDERSVIAKHRFEPAYILAKWAPNDEHPATSNILGVFGEKNATK